MGSARQDVQRLFGHFGLDPADYVVSFARKEAPVAKSTAHPVVTEAGHRAAEFDLFDYRNFELAR